MNVLTMPQGMLSQMLNFVRPAFVQTAALCVREGPEGPQVLLVKTLRRGHWIVPKGWPINKKSLAEAAAIEAWEEAGVKGRVSEPPIGAFTYTKIKKSGLPVQCRPQVFRLDVEKLHDRYPEANKRTRQWFALPDAVRAVQNPELKALLSALALSEQARTET